MLALPMVGLLAKELIERFPRPATLGLGIAGVATFALTLGWSNWSPFRSIGGLNIDSAAAFLNRDGHDQYRYLTLGFGNALPKLSTYSDAPSIDGEYNSARLLPEMTSYGSAQLTSAKFFGTAGMDSLRAILQHANKYGLKYIFVHDRYYEPLLVFAGWHQIEVYDEGAITVWSKDHVPPAHKIISDAIPAPWEGLMWAHPARWLHRACSLFPDCHARSPAHFSCRLSRFYERTTVCSRGPSMNRLLGVLLIAVTLVLVGWGYMESAGAAGVLRSDDTPERATNSLLQKIRARDFGSAYDSLANAGKLDRDDFIHDLAGTDGSLRTYSSLQDTDVTMIHKVGDEATMRVKMNWSTAVGTVSETRDMKVVGRVETGTWSGRHHHRPSFLLVLFP